jgi:Amidohydrolase
MSATSHAAVPEYNVTGIDLYDPSRFRYDGRPIIDVHTHVMRTQTPDPPEGSLVDPEPSLEQAEMMLDIAEQFGVGRLYTMCPADDIPPLRERFGGRLGFTGLVSKPRINEPDDEVFRRLERYLSEGVELIKFWAAPRGRDRGLFVDAPWRIEAARRARAAGVRTVMVHVADPDTWFQTTYADTSRFGTKEEQYVGLHRLLEKFPDLTWIAAHMGGDVEHPDHLEALLEKYPHLYFDTSATKWQVREVSPRREAVRGLISRHPGRFLFGSDLVTRHGLHADHYASRYWCQRTLWETDWEGPSPIRDPDHKSTADELPAPILRGVNLPDDILRQVYHDNASRLFPRAQLEPGQTG